MATIDTQIGCSKETRAKISRLKESPMSYDDALRELITAYEEQNNVNL